MANAAFGSETQPTTMPNAGPGYEAKYAYSETLTGPEYHCHDFYEFYIHIRGGQRYGMYERLFQLRPNQLFIIPPFVMHGLSYDDVLRGYERAYVNVTTEMVNRLGFGKFDLDGFFRSYTSKGNYAFQLSALDAEACVSYVKRIQESTPSDDPADGFAGCCALAGFLSTVCQTMRLSSSVIGDDIPSSVIQNVLAYINGHYTQTLKMEDIARRFGISVSYLSHEFTKFTKRSVYEYILYRRVMLAKQMMSGDMSLNQIAYQCGFGDYSNFLRMFNKLVGMSPSQYRKQIRLPQDG
ncbi:MAG: helix-turn-helix transcriptional regulator [Clostridia bacterium]|nr:helix-turn-helix transcriptional regulator [Clostridia bacterium]